MSTLNMNKHLMNVQLNAERLDALSSLEIFHQPGSTKRPNKQQLKHTHTQIYIYIYMYIYIYNSHTHTHTPSGMGEGGQRWARGMRGRMLLCGCVLVVVKHKNDGQKPHVVD